MKIDKKKIVFASILLIVLIFTVSYSILVFFSDDELQTVDQTVVPELMEEETSYSSKMKALDALKEERERQIPSVYSETLLDSMGVYDPSLEKKERDRVIDSIYEFRFLDVDDPDSFNPQEAIVGEQFGKKDSIVPREVSIQDLALEHSAFFHAGNTTKELIVEPHTQEKTFSAVVSGDQTVRSKDRLELRLSQEMALGGMIFPKNTAVFGFVTLQPNRVQIEITHIQNFPVQLKAYDLQDSNEGIYIENSIRDEAGRKVLGDVIQDINIGGLPQISGIKSIFRKNNRNKRVTVIDQYQLLLKF